MALHSNPSSLHTVQQGRGYGAPQREAGTPALLPRRAPTVSGGGSSQAQGGGAGGPFTTVRAFLSSPFVWIGTAVSIAAIALTIRGLHVRDVADAMGETNIGWLALAVAAALVSYYPRVKRWRVLFYPTGIRSDGDLFGAITVGYMLNNLLPLRVGELGRAFVIGRTEGIASIQALSTILVERLLDILVLFAVLMVLLPFVDEPGWATGVALVLGFGALVFTVVLAVAAIARHRVAAVLKPLFRRAPERQRDRLERWLDAGLAGLVILSHPRVLVKALFWSVAGWGVSSVFVYGCLMSLGIHLSYAAPVFVMVAVNLGMAVPSSSGYVGVYHAIVIEALTEVFSVNRERAAALAIVTHGVFYVMPVLLGAAYLWRRRELWRELLPGVLRIGEQQPR